ncbi:MAG: hypothetical protein BKP49_10935 [Treponema sp. CETP13]|nr:MAG: hypothetical protein BKP49_10935 [Treponema sp. CETP13]
MNQLEKLFRAYESGNTFTAFDTETTGLQPQSCNVIEIGAVKFNKNGIIDTYGTLINPNTPIPYQITKITHITDEMVSNSPRFSAIAPEFNAFIAETTLIAHNAEFDVSFMNAEFERNNMKKLHSPAVPAIDTVPLARKAFPQCENHKLQYLATYFNIESGNAHRATDDARVCMEVFLQCIESFRKANPQITVAQPSLF